MDSNQSRINSYPFTQLEPNKYAEGYWASGYEAGQQTQNLPTPIDSGINVDIGFLTKLTAIENLAKTKYKTNGVPFLNAKLCYSQFMGYSPCRLCKSNNGSGETSIFYKNTADVVFPEGLLHYYITHRVQPSREFVNIINDTYELFKKEIAKTPHSSSVPFNQALHQQVPNQYGLQPINNPFQIPSNPTHSLQPPSNTIQQIQPPIQQFNQPVNNSSIPSFQGNQHVDNKKLIVAFRYLSLLRDIQGEEGSKNALNTVADGIETANFQIISGEQAKQNIKGVGVKSVSYINSILKNTDPSKCGIYELDTLDPNTMHKLLTIFEMLKISGVGLATAKVAYNNGMTDINVFKQWLATQGTARQQIGIKYEEEFQKRIPRDKITKFIDVFSDNLALFNIGYGTKIDFEIGGSYRREKETSGDIDILLWCLVPNQLSSMFPKIVEYFEGLGILKDKLSFGNVMYQGTGFIDEEYPSVRIDIKALKSINDYYYSVLYFTGSGKFNEMMREKAKSMGLTLGNDEMIINSTGEKIYVRNEKDIFNILGVEWVEPSKR